MKERERLAWTVLIVAFCIFLVLITGIPFGVYQWIQHATIDPHMLLQSLEGTAQVEQPGEASRLLLPQQGALEIRPQTSVFNYADAETLLLIQNPYTDQELANIQIFPNTEIEITVAKSPRYQASPADHRLEVTVNSGRIRLTLAADADRPVDVRSHTPHAQFLLWNSGSYTVDVNTQQSQITVREGKASIIAPDGQIVLEEQQRGEVGTDGQPMGPLRPERDLISNGDFRFPLDPSWQTITDAAEVDQPVGSVEVIESDGQNSVRLERQGIGHAQTGITQLINQHLNGYQSLQLLLSARLDSQSLGRCGTVGSECPLMVQIDYQDTSGKPRQWVQGFYSWIDPNASLESQPALCVTCPPPRQQHEQHPAGTQFFYDSPNLIELLTQNGDSPASITSITVYASGHSYVTQIDSVQLLVEE